jgi:hypothetical protein
VAELVEVGDVEAERPVLLSAVDLALRGLVHRAKHVGDVDGDVDGAHSGTS